MTTLTLIAGVLLVGLLFLLGAKRGFLSAPVLLSVSIFFGIYYRYLIIYLYYPSAGSFHEVLTRYSEIYYAEILSEIALALLFMILGYVYLNKRKSASVSALVRTFDIAPDRISLRACLLVFGAVWGFFLLQLLESYGSLEVAFAVLQKKGASEDSDILIAGSLLFMAAAALAVASVRARHSKRGGRNARTFVLLLACAHLAIVLVTRSRQETIIHAATVLYPLFSKRMMPRPISVKNVLYACLAGVAAIGVLAVGSAIRTAGRGETSFDAALFGILDTLPIQLSDTFNFLDLYAAARHYAQTVGYTWGTNYLDFAARIIPRDFWPDKPVLLGTKLRELFFGDRLAGVPPTIFGEFYIAFGVFGVALGSFLFGGIARRLTLMQSLGSAQPVVGVMYVYTVLTIAIGTVKTGFEMGLFTLIYFFAGLGAVKVFSRVFRPKPITMAANPVGPAT